MKYLQTFKKYEAIIIPNKIKKNNDYIDSFESLVKYGEDNGFDVVNYDDFYNSLPESEKSTAPPRHAPFFALYHTKNKKPMFVLSDLNALRFIRNFKELVDDIISHEMIHSEQSKRMNHIEYKLPSPTNTKDYLSNKEEIMAFSWTIANGLAKNNSDIKSALEYLNKRGGFREEYISIWSDIKKYCDEKTLKRYRKYIYLYLERIFDKKEE